MFKKLTAEFIGTFWLVFIGCGAAIISAAFPNMGIGILGIALAFGLSLMTMAYAVGGISGGHFNPAVSLGLMTAGRFPAKDLIPYWVAQVAGAIVAAGALYLIASGKADFTAGGFASNGYGEFSPGGYSLFAAIISEMILTGFFIFVILSATSSSTPGGFAPIAIGLCLTAIILMSGPIANTSVNPARSTGVALFADVPAMSQLWAFWVAPLLGGVLGGAVWKTLFGNSEAK
ncbi:aquaporin Z [Brucella thiophenivorans]|uniref:Aquaporin Z 2 n=1 Tax=Brucella thiophenivorans TaxID=571255 RepID=A0A256G3J6_9HYPH|nr:aquaporin Z [Brucella thiophenivorans]OYR21662.1 aquaporin Z 2 [Brucella thiophenivorans]